MSERRKESPRQRAEMNRAQMKERHRLGEREQRAQASGRRWSVLEAEGKGLELRGTNILMLDMNDVLYRSIRSL